MALALKEIHPVSHANERQLVRAVRAGDDRAFEQLFARYRRRISGYVYGLLNDHGRAEDITQEVFISALRRLRETERPISFKPWIYEIARNACIDEFRRVSRASMVSLDLDPERDGVAPPQLADLSTPEVRWEAKQQIGDLFGAFSSLTDNQHRILVLRELEGLSYGEIGERMGMSRPMVESTLFRARRRLTQEYDELASGRRCLEVQAAVDQRDARGLATLGLRERRRIARHLHHCSDCLRHARLAGVDDAALRVTSPARRVAALLPFGWVRIAWHRAAARASGHQGAVRAAQRAGGLAEGTPQSVAVGRAAAAAAALLITGGSFSVLAEHHGRPALTPSAAPAAAPAWLPASAASAIQQVPYLITPRTTSTTASSKRPTGRRDARAAAAAKRNLPRAKPVSRGSRASTTGRAPAAAQPGAPAGAGGGAAGAPLGGGVPLPIGTPLGTIVSRGTSAAGGVTNKVTGVVSTVPGSIPPLTVTVPSVTLPSAGGATPSPSTPSVTLPGVQTPGLTIPAASGVTVPAASGLRTPIITIAAGPAT